MTVSTITLHVDRAGSRTFSWSCRAVPEQLILREYLRHADGWHDMHLMPGGDSTPGRP
jgi:hypothetical protein